MLISTLVPVQCLPLQETADVSASFTPSLSKGFLPEIHSIWATHLFVPFSDAAKLYFPSYLIWQVSLLPAMPFEKERGKTFTESRRKSVFSCHDPSFVHGTFVAWERIAFVLCTKLKITLNTHL